MACLNKDESISLWDTVSGVELRVFKGHSGYARAVAVSPNGGFRCLGGGEDGTIKIWSSKDGSELRTLKGHDGGVFSVDFMPDGKKLVSGGRDNTIKIWDVENEFEAKTLFSSSFPTGVVDCSATGDRLYVQDQPSNITSRKFVLDATTGEVLSNAKWDIPEKSRFNQYLETDRWIVFPSGKSLVRVDRDFKNKPGERAFRESKAESKLHWHSAQAKNAIANGNWYSAVFHSAWGLKADPNQPVPFVQLHSALEILTSECVKSGIALDAILPPVVVEMLELKIGVALPRERGSSGTLQEGKQELRLNHNGSAGI